MGADEVPRVWLVSEAVSVMMDSPWGGLGGNALLWSLLLSASRVPSPVSVRALLVSAGAWHRLARVCLQSEWGCSQYISWVK